MGNRGKIKGKFNLQWYSLEADGKIQEQY